MKPLDDAHDTHLPSCSQGQINKQFTLKEVAEILGYSYETVRLLVKNGELEHWRRPGCAIRVSMSAVIEFQERHKWPAQENQPASSEFEAKRTGTSETDGKSTAQALRMRRRLNAS